MCRLQMNSLVHYRCVYQSILVFPRLPITFGYPEHFIKFTSYNSEQDCIIRFPDILNYH